MGSLISSERLDLVLLAPAVLGQVAAADLAGIERSLGVTVPGEWPATVPAARRLAQLDQAPAQLPWLVRAVIPHGLDQVVGTVGFHAPPDDDGTVEIGYEILPSFRRRGFAVEAVRALTGWAFSTGQARTCRASIGPDNVPSLALAKSLGFVQVGEQVDPEDGPELVFEHALPLPPDPRG